MLNNKTELSGLLLIDKPRDYSSHDIINIARKVLQTRKIGHSGTLDPMATGLLILLIGRAATKRQGFFQAQSKTYCATLKLGVETDTWDAYGTEEKRLPVPTLTLPQIRLATQQLTGQVKQPIPFFSAKRIKGKHMYDLMLKGHELQRTYNTVTIDAWDDVQLTAPDEIQFTLSCSCGTYVRALAWMLANALGTTGHLTQLRRVETGGFNVQDALDGSTLKELPQQKALLSVLPANWHYTPQEELLRQQTAAKDRRHTAQIKAEEQAGLIAKTEPREVRKEALRKIHEAQHAANLLRFETEKMNFLASKKRQQKMETEYEN